MSEFFTLHMVMEDYSYSANFHFSPGNDDEYQEKYILTLEKHLQEGGNIDKIITPRDVFNGDNRGLHEPATILFHAINAGDEKIVKYALDKGADITKEVKTGFFFEFVHKHNAPDPPEEWVWNALELSIWKRSEDYTHSLSYINIYGMLKEKSLQLFSPFGLLPLHVESGALKIIF